MTIAMKSYARLFLASFTSLILLGADARLRAETTLLPFNSEWRYFDFGYQPAPDWFSPVSDDSGWNLGLGQFGYGDGDEATTVSYGADDENKYVTTYFRTLVYIDNPGDYASLSLHLLRDDGAVVYLNGSEIFRSNMPADPIAYGTYAASRLTYPAEVGIEVVTLVPSQFIAGNNLIAVEVHQFEPASPDLSFDLALIGSPPPAAVSITRGPYLQVGTSSNLVVRWRTSAPVDTRVRYGTSLANLNQIASSGALVTDHEIKLPGLVPDTKYFYDIGTTALKLAGDGTYYFVSSPVPGPARSTRIWAIGDFGTGAAAQYNVRNAYQNFTGARNTDVWLMLGDNAYYTGQDSEYQAFVFNIYPELLRRTVVWPTVGNHETSFSQVLTDAWDYYAIFTMPTLGQAGGVPSGTEHYYSYDYANIHFICLDSMTAVFRQPNGAMAQWLKADLADTTRDWIIAYFHHPPYTKGSHNSDAESDLIQMRGNILPILESFGVDLVLSGHSHSYERSYLIDGHYGLSTTINASHYINAGDGRTNGTGAYLKPGGGLGAGLGTVYIVDGSSGGQGGGGLLNHPAMNYSTLTHGSLVLDITGQRLDGSFVTGSGTVADTFTILKEDYPSAPRPSLRVGRAGNNVTMNWPTSVPDYRLETTAALNDPNWLPATVNLSTNGRRKSVTLSPADAQRFFQLHKQP